MSWLTQLSMRHFILIILVIALVGTASVYFTKLLPSGTPGAGTHEVGPGTPSSGANAPSTTPAATPAAPGAQPETPGITPVPPVVGAEYNAS